MRVQEGAASRNIELLRRAEAMPSDWYDSRYPLPSTARRTPYARPLSQREVLGVVEYDIGNERRSTFDEVTTGDAPLDLQPPPTDQAAGVVNILVAFAPLRPAEFVIVNPVTVASVLCAKRMP